MDTDSNIWLYPHTGMTSGQGIAVEHTYDMYVGKSGRAWFVPNDIPNVADQIHCTDSDDWDKAGRGFGGTALTLIVTKKDGKTIAGEPLEFVLKGGWHSNDNALKNDTGVDVSDKHLTYGAVGFERLHWSSEHPEYNMGIARVLYADEQPTIGTFNRIQNIAQRLANMLNQEVQYSVSSDGGGSAGPVKPERGE